MSLQANEAISNIFKLISDKETGREGIQQLYEFKQKNPDVDIEHFLQGANPIFRKFIDDGLAELENAGGRADDNNSNKVLSENRFATKTLPKRDADYYMERLNNIKTNWQRAGSSQQPEEQYSDNRSSTENLNANLVTKKTTIMQSEVRTNPRGDLNNQSNHLSVAFQVPEPVSNNRLEMMKRLAQIRSQK